MDRCILVATDGEAPATGSLRCAQDLARRLGLPLEVVSICEPGGVYRYESVDLVAGVASEMEEEARRSRRERVARQLAEAGVEGQPPIHVEIGNPAATIARLASLRGAHAIVVGRGSHSAVERVLGDETALRLMQSAHTPVLSVPDSYAELPSRILAAVDFTSYSVAAARQAADLLPAGGELHLVHVSDDQIAMDLSSWRETEWMRAMRQEVEGRLGALAEEISTAAPRVRVQAHITDGRPVQSVLRLAEELEVEMVAAGTNGYGFLGRLLMGSVATQLVRRARCMTLIAPPRGNTPSAERPLPHLRRAKAARTSVAEAGISRSC